MSAVKKKRRGARRCKRCAEAIAAHKHSGGRLITAGGGAPHVDWVKK
jgi:hypothetical protein